MDSRTRQFVETVLVAAHPYDSEALDRAHQKATAEAAKHRERERWHRQEAETAEILARRLAGIRQLKSADISDPGVPAGRVKRETSAAGHGSQELSSQAELVRRAIDTRTAGGEMSPKQIFDLLKSQGADVDLNNVQLEMGRLVKKGKLVRPSRGKYEIPPGGS